VLKQLQDETEAFIDDIHSLASSSTAATISPAKIKPPELNGTSRPNCLHPGPFARIAASEKRPRKSSLDIATEHIQAEQCAKQIAQATDKVLYFLEEQSKKHHD
jgi:hypothetical protein